MSPARGIDMKLYVTCYVGRKGDERAIHFRWIVSNILWKRIIDQWSSLKPVVSKVRAEDSNV
jgi:hypothetical protein